MDTKKGGYKLNLLEFAIVRKFLGESFTLCWGWQFFPCHSFAR